MIGFLANNIGTIAVALGLLTVIAAIAAKMIKNKKSGRKSCSCGCGDCPLSGKCGK